MSFSPTNAVDRGRPSSTPVVRVLIADDHAIVRDGLRLLIDAQPGLVVVGEAANGQEAWRRSCALRPHIVVLDLSMPDGGAEAAERIRKDCPDVRIVVLTMHEERGYVTRLLRLGVAGYVLKRTPAAELVKAIRSVANGGTFVDPSLAASLLGMQNPSADASARAKASTPLTPRENEVLRLVARGHSNKEISASLEISVKTVETHKATAMSKLGLTSRAAVIRYAIDEGWLDTRR